MTPSNNNIDDLIFNMSLTDLREMTRNSEPVSVVYRSHNDIESENDGLSEFDEHIFNMTVSELRDSKVENTITLNVNDSVVLLTDLPQKQLKKGHVGRIIDIESSHIFKVEFVNQSGQILISTPVKAIDLLKLNYALHRV